MAEFQIPKADFLAAKFDKKSHFSHFSEPRLPAPEQFVFAFFFRT